MNTTDHILLIDPHGLARAFCDEALFNGYAESSVRVYYYTIRRFLEWARDDRGRELAEIEPADLIAWNRQRTLAAATGRMNRRRTNTVYRQATQLKTFFRWCVKTGRIETDPSELAELPPKGTDRLVEPLSRDQVDQLLDYARTTGHRFDRARNLAFLVFLYDSLLRVSEALALNIRDVQGDRITVRGKGGKWRTIALNPIPAQLIDSYLLLRLDPNEKLWATRRGRPWTYPLIQTYLRRAALALDLPDLTAHNLRRTAATEMVEAHVPTPLIQHIGGWTDLRSMNRYIAHAGARAAVEAHRMHGPAGRLAISPPGSIPRE